LNCPQNLIKNWINENFIYFQIHEELNIWHFSKKKSLIGKKEE